MDDNYNYVGVKSIDGGLTWDNIDIPYENFYFNANNYACSWKIEDNYLEIDRMKTSSNEGETWIDYQTHITEKNIRDIFFVNEMNGWIWGDSLLLKTTDGGQHWEFMEINLPIRKIHFINENDGYLCVNAEGVNMYYTDDGGVIWHAIYLPWALHSGVYDFEVVSEDTIWICGHNTHLYSTYDKGLSWEDHSLWVGGYLSEVYFFNDTIAWTSGQKGVFYTENAWETFTNIMPDPEYPYVEIDFIDQHIGFMHNTHHLLKTEDGGITWNEIFNDYRIYDMQLLDNGSIYCLNYAYSKVSSYRVSFDQGSTWKHKELNSNGLTKMYFLEDGNAWVAGKNGKIVHNNDLVTSFPEDIVNSSSIDPIVYPNPTYSIVNVLLENELYNFGVIRVYATNGKLLRKVGFHNKRSVNLDLTGNKPGVYVIQIRNGSNEYTAKVVLNQY